MMYSRSGTRFDVPLSIDDIGAALAARIPQLLPLEGRRHAAVALLLRPAPLGPEMLFIRRAHCDGDPWSGDLGFPGGKVDPEDNGARAAAEREVEEEVGLSLSTARFLGRLDDISGAHLPVLISCFAFAVPEDSRAVPGEEAIAAFWVPLQHLLDRDRWIEATVYFRGEPLQRPAVRLLPPGETVLWGITYRLVSQFLRHLGQNMPSGELGEDARFF